MVLNYYFKELRKNWLIGVAPAILLGLLAILMAVIWPEFEEYMIDMQELLQADIYQALLSSGALELGMDSFEGFLGMEFGVFLVFVIIAIGVTQGASIVTREIDRQTIDIVLSFPIPRWQLLLEKFAVANTYTLLFPIIIGLSTTLGVMLAGFADEVDLVALWSGFAMTWFLFYTAMAISLLCGTIFLRSGRSYMISGGILTIFLFMDRFGGLVETTRWVKDFSLFNYLEFSNVVNEVMNHSRIPIIEVVGVFGFGTLCLLLALFIFQRREITY
jgi:ABC-2 type transport system permease protein